ncbi:hypothetical protein OG2516_04224 [Oceanicola granulosus HTCC2516]|uniref:NlpC/P60 domain-containing protein n=1 Tax=Oceanicola granulosus (strain ATCC BAA-861 / DSM 15982 / KCTC 12143 / HTCC2516) TaxID=314256 RepID=Q2CEC4_OCEGH|nr:NlpC/P60 family protein [Oceanicola granulosus]EAR51073.1 hypothetical protein OG2516_04224 [Oceanicola granulosus HTCC2516]
MSAVVVIARRWTGTPYRHQASCEGVGCDCLGLVRGIWRELHGGEPAPIPAYAPDWAEAGGSGRLLAAARRHLAPADTPAPGDVLLFRLREGGAAQHLGIATDLAPVPRFVHAYARHGVVESPLSGPWQRRLVARFAFPQRSR